MSGARHYQKSNHTFFSLRTEDDNNLTCVNRNASSYNDILELKQPLDETILTWAKQNNTKVRLLDVGCGECRAIDDLLSNIKLKNALEKADGISLHDFSSVYTVKQNHGARFNYYHGDAEKVLKELKGRYNIILDVMGAFAYTANKMHLLKLYHQALEPNGMALIMLPYPLNRVIIKKDSNDEYMDVMLRNYPDTFKIDNQLLVLKKHTAEFPLSDTKVETFEEASSINEDLSIETLRQGNALWPKNVILRTEKEVRNTPHKFS